MLSALVAVRADPNLACVSESGSVVTPSWLASHPSHVRTLLEMRADFTTSPPLIGVVGISSAATVRAFLEVRCDPTNVSSNGFGVMYSVAFFGRGS